MSFCQGSWPDCKIICKHFNTRFLGTEWLSLKPSSLGSLGDLKSFYKMTTTCNYLLLFVDIIKIVFDTVWSPLVLEFQ